MADAWGIELGEAGDDRQLKDDLAQECRATAADYAIVRRMVSAALVGSLIGDAETSLDGTAATIVISFRAARA